LLINLTPLIPLSLARRGGGIKKRGRSPPLKTNSPFPSRGRGSGGWGYHIKIKGFPEKSKIF
jgi:hypothetical protein